MSRSLTEGTAYSCIGVKNDRDGDYNAQEDEGYDDDEGDYANSRSDSASTGRPAAIEGRRRSERSIVLNGNAKRAAEATPWTHWRGERRSTRLGAPPETQLDEPPPKRARTDESSLSGQNDTGPAMVEDSKWGVKSKGAAKVKSSEVAVELLA